MRTYVTFKHCFEYESYLNMSNEDHRKSLTRLRISAHRLAIERGRYTVPFTPADKRLCKLCNNDEVEDEFHFLMSCSHYKQLRTSLNENILNECKNFGQLEKDEQFAFMLIAGDRIACHVAKYTENAFRLRKSGVTS